MIELSKDRWVGNQWAAIAIDPVDEAYFLPLLTYLAQTYDFEMPQLVDRITGYWADFKILGAQATFDLDTYHLSLAFSEDSVRDQVYEQLQANLETLNTYLK